MTDVPDEPMTLEELERQVRASLEEMEEQVRSTEDLAMATQEALARLDQGVTAAIGELKQVRHTSPEGVLARLEAMERKVAETVLTAEISDLNGVAEEVGTALGQFDVRVARLEKLYDTARATTSDESAPHDGVPGRTGGASRKVLELMRLVPTLGKDKTAAKSAGGFQFRSIDSAMDAVGQAMRTVGLILSPKIDHVDRTQYEMTNRDDKSLTWTSTFVTATYSFIDPEDGSIHQAQMVGEGRDATDKATSKAVSMALKYGLLQALMIGVTDLSDTDSDGGGQIERTGPHAAPPPDPMARALGAKDAIDRLATRPRGEALAQLLLIEEQCARERLMSVEVRGATVESWIATARKVLTSWESSEEPPPERGESF